MGSYYVGVDVGTSSVRAALVTATGQVEVTSTKAISIWEPRTDFYEQSSDEIWQAVCKVVRVGARVCHRHICIVWYCIVFIHFYSTSHSMSLSEATDTVSEFTCRSTTGNCK